MIHFRFSEFEQALAVLVEAFAERDGGLFGIAAIPAFFPCAAIRTSRISRASYEHPVAWAGSPSRPIFSSSASNRGSARR